MKNKTRIYLIAGVIATCMSMIGDYLLEYTTGFHSVELGSMGFVESAWEQIPIWRFTASLWLGAFSIPLSLLGFWGLKRTIDRMDSSWAKRFWVFAAAGTAGGGFIHVVLCLLPVAWKTVLPAGETLATATVEAMGRSMLFPFFFFYFVLVFGPTLMLTIATFKGKTPYRRWQMLLCPLIFILAGAAVQALFGEAGDWFLVGSASRGLMAPFLLGLWVERKR